MKVRFLRFVRAAAGLSAGGGRAPDGFPAKAWRAGPAGRRVLILVFLFLAFPGPPTPALSGSAMAAGGHPWDNKRVYYLIEYQGRIREKGFFVRHPGSYRKLPCIIYDEEKTSSATLNGLPVTRSFQTKTITTPEGYALYRHERTLLGDSGEETVTVAGGAAEFAASGYFGGPARIETPERVLFEISGEWLASQNPQTGKRLEVAVLDREARRTSMESVLIGDRLENFAESDAPAIWAAEFISEGRPPMEAVFTGDGRLLRLESEGLVYQVATREEYEAGRLNPRPARISAGASGGAGESGDEGLAVPAIPVGAVIPAWDAFTWLVLRAGPAGQWESQLGNSPYAQVDVVAGQHTITAVRYAPRADASAVLPMQTPPDIQPFLASPPLAPSENPAIIQNARVAVADLDTRRQETNVLKAVSYLAGWINQEIAFTAPPQPGLGAADVLRNRRGDSIGHARLFAAMARSLGIPARICQGMLVKTGQAAFHAWAEAWIGGEWVPVDTTVSRVGLPAGYILAERSGPDCRLSPGFLDFLTTPLLTLAMVSAGRETPLGALAELVVGDRRTYAAYEGDWLANLYWGFALRLPAGWNGRARLNSVEIASPDRAANVKCEALEGEFRAGQSELESNIGNLRDNLQSFSLVDERLVTFDPDGAAPALFIDFTCEQDGSRLRCRQYVLPRSRRAFRISFWAPAASFDQYAPSFDSILASFEF